MVKPSGLFKLQEFDPATNVGLRSRIDARSIAVSPFFGAVALGTPMVTVLAPAVTVTVPLSSAMLPLIERMYAPGAMPVPVTAKPMSSGVVNLATVDVTWLPEV